jgi:hypothetical protein
MSRVAELKEVTMTKGVMIAIVLAMGGVVVADNASAQGNSDVPMCSATVRDHCIERQHVYRGQGGHYHGHCGGGNGAVGTVVGGVGGGLIGGAAIGGPVAVVAGAVGGGLLGNHLDKAHTRSQNGC